MGFQPRADRQLIVMHYEYYSEALLNKSILISSVLRMNLRPTQTYTDFFARATLPGQNMHATSPLTHKYCLFLW